MMHIGLYKLDHQSPESVCAEATLSRRNLSGELTGDALSLVEGFWDQSLQDRLGSFSSGVDPVGVGFSGDTFNGGRILGEVVLPELESVENFLDASFTVSARASIADFPEARLATTVTKNSLRGGSLLANLTWDGGELSLALSADNFAALGNAEVRIFNSQGFELDFDAEFDQNGDFVNVEGDALVNGEDIGDITTRNDVPVITFPNGEEVIFETLF